MKTPEQLINKKRRKVGTYVPPPSKKFLPVRKKDFEEVARAAGFTSISKHQVDAMGEVGHYLMKEVGASDLGVTYVARSHELTERITKECDNLIAECASMDEKVELLKLLQGSARQMAENGRLLVKSQYLDIQSTATIVQSNRSAPPGSVSVPTPQSQSVTVQVEPLNSSQP